MGYSAKHNSTNTHIYAAMQHLWKHHKEKTEIAKLPPKLVNATKT
jgi:hypothetical protein